LKAVGLNNVKNAMCSECSLTDALVEIRRVLTSLDFRLYLRLYCFLFKSGDHPPHVLICIYICMYVFEHM